MGFFSCTSKFILFFFNIVVMLLSLAALGVSVYAYIHSKNFGAGVSVPNILIIVVACVITLLAFLGCWGAVQENRCYLHMYASILLILLVILVAIGAYVIIKKADAESEIAHFVEEQFDNALAGDNTAMSFVDGVQSSFKCCGTYSFMFWTLHGKAAPSSCNKDSNSNQLIPDYRQGCESEVLSFFKSTLKLTGTFAIVVGCIELAGVVLAFILSSSIKRQSLRGHM